MSRFRSTIAVAIAALALTILCSAAGCGTERPGVGSGGYDPRPRADACATPNEGCPCDSPGLVVDCGTLHHSSPDGYAVCEMGRRACQADGRWGPCVTTGELKTTTYVIGGGMSLGGGSMHTLALGNSTSCTGTFGAGVDVCVGGSKDGHKCDRKVKCPGGTCSPGRCEGGSKDDEGCSVPADCPGGTCKLGPDGRCIGGQNNGKKCKDQCPGGACTSFFGICNGGANDDQGCNIAAECPGGTCEGGEKGYCIGGAKDGKNCKDASKCPGGFCYLPDAGGTFFNPCDPYCEQFVDTPGGLVFDGGITLGSGGLTISPEAGLLDGGGLGAFTSTAGGVSGCAPTSRNIVGPACTPPGLTTCQQDFRCDPTTSQCLWNGGPGYYDSALGGIDLTVGVPCGPPGSAPSTVPVCNRGSVPVPAGSPIRLHQTNGPSPPDGCTDLGPPTFSFTLAAALAPGDCTSFSIGNSPGAKYITVNAGVPGGQPINEAPGRCANNSAYWMTDGPNCSLCNNSCSTRLTGTIFDPRGVNPLPGVIVYVPTKTPSPLPPDGVPSCDTCASLISGSPFSQAVTDYKGQFSLDVPPGGFFPLVIQTGRWRRVVTVPAVPACTTATLSSALSRLPRNKTEGNIPKMAVVMAAGDQLECLLRKVGIDDAEFTAGGGPGRVHLYRHNGMTFSGATNGLTNLYGNAATLNSYSAVIAPCDNIHRYPGPVVGPTTTFPPPFPIVTAAQRANVKAFLDAGGRLFTTHWTAHDLTYVNWPGPTGPAQEEFGTNVNDDREPPSLPYFIDTSTPLGTLLSQWAPYVGAGAAGPPPTITFHSWRHLSKTVNTASGAIRLTYGDSTQPPVSHPQNASQWGGPHVSMYQFDTPWAGSPPGPQCGRVGVAQSHVSSGSGAFPGGCGSAATAMTPQEKAFEFLLFSSQSCLGVVPPPPAPPPPPPLPSVTFTRDYEGVCPPGYSAVWQPFYWQAVIPPGTSIAFSAATAATQSGLPATSTSPGVHPIGTATSTVLSPSWGCDGCPSSPVTVDYHLRNDPPPPNSPSRAWLRVFLTFTPNNTTSPPTAPTLTAWRQVYGCVPSE